MMSIIIFILKTSLIAIDKTLTLMLNFLTRELTFEILRMGPNYQHILHDGFDQSAGKSCVQCC